MYIFLLASCLISNALNLENNILSLLGDIFLEDLNIFLSHITNTQVSANNLFKLPGTMLSTLHKCFHLIIKITILRH